MAGQAFGVVGLEVMGRNVAQNIERNGFPVAVFNRTEEKTKDYGAYAVLVQLLADVRIVHKVSPQVFEPPPRVWSAVVEMRRKEKPQDYRRIKELVLGAFRSRRKRLVNNLPEPVRGAAPRTLGVLGHGPDARPEELPPEDFAALARALSWGFAG